MGGGGEGEGWEERSVYIQIFNTFRGGKDKFYNPKARSFQSNKKEG